MISPLARWYAILHFSWLTSEIFKPFLQVFNLQPSTPGGSSIWRFSMVLLAVGKDGVFVKVTVRAIWGERSFRYYELEWSASVFDFIVRVSFLFRFGYLFTLAQRFGSHYGLAVLVWGLVIRGFPFWMPLARVGWCCWISLWDGRSCEEQKSRNEKSNKMMRTRLIASTHVWLVIH